MKLVINNARVISDHEVFAPLADEKGELIAYGKFRFPQKIINNHVKIEQNDEWLYEVTILDKDDEEVKYYNYLADKFEHTRRINDYS